jgi:imidazolonepropionase-like amidohydrolase
VGFVQPGYDADIVVWDSNPLSVGATPRQVYIDGRATLDTAKVADSASMATESRIFKAPKQRRVISSEVTKFCEQQVSEGGKLVITGIRESFLDHATPESGTSGNSSMIIENGKTVCFGDKCAEIDTSNAAFVHLENGYVSPGLTAVSVSLGLIEIPSEGATTDGDLGSDASSSDPKNVVYAKYGVHLEGKNFKRARIGGITRAISAPTGGGLFGGVSVGIKTKEQKVLSLDDGIFKDEVALHVQIGQASKRKLLFRVQCRTKCAK